MVKSREVDPHPYNPEIDVLLLCTANQCRSPMAEVLLRHHLHRAGIDATVSSAGLLQGGRPATPHAIEAMRDRGLDLDGHRSRQLSAELIERADLIVAMAREHVREVAVLDAGALRRAFTLKELVQVASGRGGRGADQTVADWLRGLDDGRRRERLIGVGLDPEVDVADPIGQPRAAYEVTAGELDELLARLVTLVWPVSSRQESVS